MGVALALATLVAAPVAGAAVLGGRGERVSVQTVARGAPPAPLGQSVMMDPLDGTDQGVAYHGGPVLHAVTTYAIFWDPGGAFAASTESLVGGFLANVAHDSGDSTNVFSVAGKYTDASGPAGYEQTYGGSLIDTDPYPPSGDCSETTTSAPTCLYGSQISDEAASFAARLGLPTGMRSLYIVLTPRTVVSCIDGSSQCSNNSYCSLHSYAGEGSSTFLYIEIPFTLLDSSSDAKSCQSDGNSAVQAPNADPGFGDVALKSLTHEMLESITDPLLNAWYDADGNEIADLCNGISWNADSFLPLAGGDAAAGTLWNQTINGAHYYLQGSWSNTTNDCALTSSPSPSFVVPAAAAPGTTLSFTASAGTNATVGSYAWSFGDGATAVGQSVTHAFAAAGSYAVTLTVTDSFGNSGSVTSDVEVGAPPGATAGASGGVSPRKSSTTRCGSLLHRRSGLETRRCTRTVVSHSTAEACKHGSAAAPGACHAVVRTVTRRALCTERRQFGASTWSRRCSAPVVVHSTG